MNKPILFLSWEEVDRLLLELIIKHEAPPIEFFDSKYRKLIQWDKKCIEFDYQQFELMNNEEKAIWDKCALGWNNEKLSKLSTVEKLWLFADLNFVYDWRASQQRRREFEQECRVSH